MPERDGYIPGVPCWVDTSQPDPEAAVDFYGGLFGWEFEDVMPPGSEGKYFIARIRGGDVAAVGSLPEGAPPDGDRGTPTSGSRAPTRPRRRCEPPGAGRDGAVRRHGRRPDGRVHRSRGGGVLRLAGEAAQGRADRQRARQPELQRPQHPRRWRARSPSTARCSAGRPSSCRGGFEMWTLPGYGDHLERDNPDLRKQMAEVGAPGGLRGRRREPHPDRRRPAGTSRRTGA